MSKILLKMLHAGGGFNAGEVARFDSVRAEKMVRKGQAVVHVEGVRATGTVQSAVVNAIALVQGAVDAKKAAFGAMRIVHDAVDSADAACEQVFGANTQEKENASHSVRLLEEAAEKAEADYVARQQAADGAVADAKKLVTKLNKEFKKADDKGEAQASIDAAEASVLEAQGVADKMAEDIVAAIESSAEQIIAARAQAQEVLTRADESVAELTAAIEAARQVDNDLDDQLHAEQNGE